MIGLKMKPPQSTPDPLPFGGTGPRGELYEPESRREFVEAYRDRPWVRRSIDLVRSSAASVPLKAMKGQGTPDAPHPDDREVEGHEILQLLNRPNHRDPAMTFIGESIFWSETVGDWHWEIIPSRGGGIAELYRLRAYSVRVKPDESGNVTHVVYRPNDESEPVVKLDMAKAPRPQAGTVISGRLTSPLDDYYGMSPLRAAKDAVISEYYAVRYDHRFFRNSARPDLIIGFKGDVDKEQRQLNREEWKSFKGVDNAHRAATMSGLESVNLLSQNPKDVEYLEGRKLNREEECGALGVPPVLVGILDHATYSNFDTARTVLWEVTVAPKLVYMCSWITHALVPFYPDIDYITPDFSKVEALQASQNERSERASRDVGGGSRTPNEGRILVGEKPLDDEAADRLYLPMGLVPITGDEPDSEPAAPTPEPMADAEDLKAKAVSVDPMPLPEPRAAKAGGVPEKAATKWIRSRGRTLDRMTELMGGQLQKLFVAERKRLFDELGVKADDDLETILSAHDWGKQADDLREVTEAFQIAAAEKGAGNTASLIGSDVDFFSLDNPKVRGVLEEIAGRPDGVKTVPDNLKDDVLAEVREGVKHGLTATDVAHGGTFNVGPPGSRDTEQVTLKGIRGVFQEFETWKGLRIARTETAYAFNGMSALTMNEAGVDEVDIHDGTECDKGCAEANGSRWPLTRYEAELLAHPNCRRVGLPVIK